MNNRYITIPALASIVTGVRDDTKGTTGSRNVEVPFEQIVLDIWSVHPSFARGIASMDAAIRIRSAFRGKKPGETVCLDDEAWTRLVSVVKAEDSGLPATVAILLREASPAYFDCIFEASTSPPRPC
jgi:hypothetical protein